jgi:hypothetical protein
MGGAKLKLLLADTEAKKKIGSFQKRRLIKEGAVCLVGPFLSGNAMTIATLCEQRGVPFVMDVAAADDITRKGFKYTFRCFAIFSTSPIICFSMSQLMKDKNISKIKGRDEHGRPLRSRSRSYLPPSSSRRKISPSRCWAISNILLGFRTCLRKSQRSKP